MFSLKSNLFVGDTSCALPSLASYQANSKKMTVTENLYMSATNTGVHPEVSLTTIEKKPDNKGMELVEGFGFILEKGTTDLIISHIQLYKRALKRLFLAILSSLAYILSRIRH